MSHFTVTVVVPRDRVDETSPATQLNSVNEFVTSVLAPYDENDEFFRPGSRWDWWVIGGRWTGYFAARPGRSGQLGRNHSGEEPTRGGFDVIRVGDVDWEVMVARSVAGAEDYWDTCAALDHPPFGIEPGTTREQYVAAARTVATHALVTSDGTWHERAQMGWFAQTISESKAASTWESEYRGAIATLAPTDYLVLVDCHV